MTLTSLVRGGTARKREALILSQLSATQQTAIILEGLPDGGSDVLTNHSLLSVVRIAPGCMCCTGNMIMRVHLNRILRSKPARLFISVANSEHIEQLRLFLTQAPYDTLLTLSDDLRCTHGNNAI